MANPTRDQIEATVALPKYKVEINTTGSTWVQVANQYVESISGSVNSTGNDDNGISFGTPSDQNLSVVMENHEYTTGVLLSNKSNILKRLRVSFAFATSDYVGIYTGVISDISISGKMVTYQIGGTPEFLRYVKIHTPLYYRKPVATKTTIATQEDPDGVGYTAGLLNLAFWRAGGRPYEQKDINYTETSTGFKFWYSLQDGLIEPDFSWFSGENALDEVYSLARAAGGQIYQDLEGVIRFVQPLSFNDQTGYASYFTFTDSTFEEYNERVVNAESVGTLKLTYTPRRLMPVEDVIEDRTPRYIPPADSIDVELAPSLPIWEYINVTQAFAHEFIKSMLIDNTYLVPTITVLSDDAALLSLRITNTDPDKPMVIYSIKIQGRPLGAGDELHVSYGSGEPERIVDNNVYIQSDAHAYRIVRLMYDFYSTDKPIVSLSGVQFDPDRYLGELVMVQSEYNKVLSGGVLIDNTNIYRIIGINHDGTGTKMDIELVEVGDLPSRDEMFIVGNTSYTDGTTKKVSY